MQYVHNIISVKPLVQVLNLSFGWLYYVLRIYIAQGINFYFSKKLNLGESHPEAFVIAIVYTICQGLNA